MEIEKKTLTVSTSYSFVKIEKECENLFFNEHDGVKTMNKVSKLGARSQFIILGLFNKFGKRISDVDDLKGENEIDWKTEKYESDEGKFYVFRLT